MKHSNYITHIKNEEDRVYLKNIHFPVNMRLFRTSPEYQTIILQQCNYVRLNCLVEKEGYKKPHGMSSANLGLSFNIIGICKNRNTKNEYCQIMINPVILKYFGDIIESESNCGSLTLDKPIKVKRYSDILVSYYNEEGVFYLHAFTRSQGSLTIQHEVDHNLGILITDKK
jgi:peptide deformylase